LDKAQQEKLQHWRASRDENVRNGAPVMEFGDFVQNNPVAEGELSRHLAMAYAPEPDLFIRTGGEARISNFLLWQLAYTELYFTNELWPDFNRASLMKAIDSYRSRERRFGRTSEQLSAAQMAAIDAA
jgi:undecaprenyl diphosphate synthase